MGSGARPDSSPRGTTPRGLAAFCSRHPVRGRGTSTCAGALDSTSSAASGATWTLEVTAPGGLGLGYLLIGFSNTSASALGGLPLPLDLAFLFGDPLWSGCSLNVDPTQNGGAVAFTFPGFDTGTVHMQAVAIDADFVARIAGVSQGVAVRRTALAGMVMVPAGSFQMGSSAASGARPVARPVARARRGVDVRRRAGRAQRMLVRTLGARHAPCAPRTLRAVSPDGPCADAPRSARVARSARFRRMRRYGPGGSR